MKAKNIRDFKNQFVEKFVEKWEAVRPVVIYFSGERFVIEYDKHSDPLETPFVAMVHCYRGNLDLTKTDN